MPDPRSRWCSAGSTVVSTGFEAVRPSFRLTPDATLWEDARNVARARTCNDCFFRRKGLCALATETPCPTFREMRAGRITAPKQPALVAPTSEGRVVVAALSR